MKRLGSSDSLGALFSMCPSSDEHSPRNNIYNNEYQSILEGLIEEEEEEETGHTPEKKRRLSVEQVKALERNFEVENKLEPERKVKLAKELGLQPRQVAVWFQNRRARWKTKQLERDYGVLKANFDSLKHDFESLQHDKDSLLKEIKDLKSKLNEDQISETNKMCIKEETLLFESEDNTTKQLEPITPPDSLSHDSEGTKLLKVKKIIFSEVKDGQSESDSSAILNEDNSPNASNSSTNCAMFQNYQQDLLVSPNRTVEDCFGFCDLRSDGLDWSGNNSNSLYQAQFVKIEEHDFFSGDEACNFFSEEQAPSLHWYCSDQWT